MTVRWPMLLDEAECDEPEPPVNALLGAERARVDLGRLAVSGTLTLSRRAHPMVPLHIAGPVLIMALAAGLYAGTVLALVVGEGWLS